MYSHSTVWRMHQHLVTRARYHVHGDTRGVWHVGRLTHDQRRRWARCGNGARILADK